LRTPRRSCRSGSPGPDLRAGQEYRACRLLGPSPEPSVHMIRWTGAGRGLSQTGQLEVARSGPQLGNWDDTCCIRCHAEPSPAKGDETPMDACVFCLIRDGKAPHSLVHSDDLVLAFMDLSPVTPGHVLVVPREHVVGLGEIGDELGGRLWSMARRVGEALRRNALNTGDRHAGSS